MRPASVVGILLVILGIFALTYQGITYTTRHKVLDIGPIQTTQEEHKTIPLSPILGGVALICGVVLLLGEANALKGVLRSTGDGGMVPFSFGSMNRRPRPFQAASPAKEAGSIKLKSRPADSAPIFTARLKIRFSSLLRKG